MQNPTPEIPKSRIAQFQKIPFKKVPNHAFIIHTDLLKANGQILKDIRVKTGAKVLDILETENTHNAILNIHNKYL